MKISRKQLRKIIIEAIMIGHDDGRPVTPSDVAYKSGIEKDKISFGKDPLLDKLKKNKSIESQRQARELATTLDFQPELTDAEQTAVEMGYHSLNNKNDVDVSTSSIFNSSDLISSSIKTYEDIASGSGTQLMSVNSDGLYDVLRKSCKK